MLLEKQRELKSAKRNKLLGKQRSWKAKLLGFVSIDAFRHNAMLVSLKL